MILVSIALLRRADRRYRLAFARLVTHYFSHAAWLAEDELIRDAGRLEGIPAVLLHGRLDLSGPPDVAWQLARAWPGAELHFVRGGHTGDAEMMERMLEAADRFARTRRPKARRGNAYVQVTGSTHTI